MAMLSNASVKEFQHSKQTALVLGHAAAFKPFSFVFCTTESVIHESASTAFDLLLCFPILGYAIIAGMTF